MPDLDTLSMRALACELGTAPMSLYRHATDKEDLFDAVIDVVFAEAEVPSAETHRKD